LLYVFFTRERPHGAGLVDEGVGRRELTNY
jgi:hypothetical protein